MFLVVRRTKVQDHVLSREYAEGEERRFAAKCVWSNPKIENSKYIR